MYHILTQNVNNFMYNTKKTKGSYMNKKTYVNHDAVIKTDKIAQKILSVNNNKFRQNFFPSLINEMKLSIGAEIGVDKAVFSQQILSKSNLSKLYCVDCWMDNFGTGHKQGPEYKKGNLRKEEALRTLSEFEGRYEVIHEYSKEAAQKIPDNSLDFCYIDGDHSLGGVYEDVTTWIKKMKKGGIISGHDFSDSSKSGMRDYWGGHLENRVETVLKYYCNRFGYKLNPVGKRFKSWWFVV